MDCGVAWCPHSFPLSSPEIRHDFNCTWPPSIPLIALMSTLADENALPLLGLCAHGKPLPRRHTVWHGYSVNPRLCKNTRFNGRGRGRRRQLIKKTSRRLMPRIQRRLTLTLVPKKSAWLPRDASCQLIVPALHVIYFLLYSCLLVSSLKPVADSSTPPSGVSLSLCGQLNSEYN